MITLSEKEKIADTEKQKDTVLFVCTGNTCRSPMCAALFNHKYAGENRIGISAGISADGSPISYGAIEALRAYGIKSVGKNDYKSHISRNVTEDILAKASLIVGVTSSHAMSLIMNYPQFASKITSFSKDIFDPFGGDDVTYAYCLKTINSALSEMFTEDKDEFHDN